MGFLARPHSSVAGRPSARKARPIPLFSCGRTRRVHCPRGNCNAAATSNSSASPPTSCGASLVSFPAYDLLVRPPRVVRFAADISTGVKVAGFAPRPLPAMRRWRGWAAGDSDPGPITPSALHYAAGMSSTAYSHSCCYLSGRLTGRCFQVGSTRRPRTIGATLCQYSFPQVECSVLLQNVRLTGDAR